MTTTPLTDQQLADAFVTAAAADSMKPHAERSGLVNVMIAVVRPELDRLATELGRVRAELATTQAERDAARERLASYGTPVLSFPPLPPVSPVYAERAALRAQLESGFVPESHVWAVGRAICPEGRQCTAGELGVFTLTKRGRLPVHRDDYERRCPGSGQKATPLKLATPAVSPSA